MERRKKERKLIWIQKKKPTNEPKTTLVTLIAFDTALVLANGTTQKKTAAIASVSTTTNISKLKLLEHAYGNMLSGAVAAATSMTDAKYYCSDKKTAGSLSAVFLKHLRLAQRKV